MAYTLTDFSAGPPVVGEQVTVFTQNGYASDVLTISAVDTVGGIITFVETASYGIGPGSRYYVSGPLALLDQAGEWSFNPTSQILSYLPITGFTGTGAVASGGNQSLFSINGATNVTIQGLTLTNVATTAYASFDATPAIYMINASYITVNSNTFTNVAEGLYLANATQDNTISNNNFSNVWGAAINLTPLSSQNLVANNTITNSGEVFGDTGAIQMTES